MNYLEDLRSYWVKGYGHRIDYSIACVLMQSLIDAIDEVIEDGPVGPFSQHGNLRFAHAETVMPLLSCAFQLPS